MIIPYQSIQENDIAIITLPSELTWGDAVTPICLPRAETFVGDEAVVAGWGTTSEGAVALYVDMVYAFKPNHTPLPYKSIHVPPFLLYTSGECRRLD